MLQLYEYAKEDPSKSWSLSFVKTSFLRIVKYFMYLPFCFPLLLEIGKNVLELDSKNTVDTVQWELMFC